MKRGYAMDPQPQYVCPLLRDAAAYNPDTIDLVNNREARNYWLPCLQGLSKKFISRAATLNPDNPEATDKARMAYEKFVDLVEACYREQSQSVLQPLSIRTLLEYNEDCLRDSHFKDAWFLQKTTESSAAFQDFKDRVNYIDSIANFEDKWVEIATGVLAGNVFDWGSTVVADILESCADFGLESAKNTIEKRPWFMDNLNAWIQRLKVEEPYKRAVIFVDNAGVDFVLGILPMARELLKQGTQVILAANSSPALNDVTFKDLKQYMVDAALLCPVIKGALEEGQLLTAENGQKGPCLDLRNVSSGLWELMSSTDLVIIEGMGRAVHTNLYAKFTVDSVKMAVLKNEWLAKNLGAKQFSVIFNYEVPN